MIIKIRIPMPDGSWKEAEIPVSSEQYTLAAVVMVSDNGEVFDERMVYVNNVRNRKPKVVISSGD